MLIPSISKSVISSADTEYENNKTKVNPRETNNNDRINHYKNTWYSNTGGTECLAVFNA